MAELDGRVVGDMLGCKDTDTYERTFSKEMSRPLLRKAVRQGIFFRRKNLIYLYKAGLEIIPGQ